MISVEEALRLLREQVPNPSIENISLEHAHLRVLAEDVFSDIDLPPFHRSMMDGYAVRSTDASGYLVVEEIPAGKSPQKVLGPGECSKIMTGAPVPSGADAVQRVEKTKRVGDRVDFLEKVEAGQNVAVQGEDLQEGEKVLSSGEFISSVHVGMLATIGKSSLAVYRRPSVAILVTGNEIVEPGEACSGATIRNANGPSLRAQCESLHLEPTYLGIARDEEADLRDLIRKGLEHDVLIITGGVSAGDWDLVIPCLEQEGVTHQFHKVSIKPGKPLFFGTRGATRIFGLPGNPVSSFVTFEVFLRPFLRWMMGGTLGDPRRPSLLKGEVSAKGNRDRYLPAWVEGEFVHPVPWNGSGDLFGLAKANCLLVVPVGKSYKEEEKVEILVFL